MIVAYASRAGFQSMRGWVLQRADAVKRGFGILVLVVGVMILFGADKWLEARVVGLLPDAWVDLTVRF